MLTKKKSLIFLTTCLFFMFVVIMAGKVSSKDLSAGYDLFIQGRDMYLNEAADYAEIVKILKSGFDEFDKLEDGFAKYYWQAQIYYVLAEMAETHKEKKAEELYAQSQELVKKSLEYNESHSDSVRLLSETYMKLMSYKGYFYQLKHLSKISDLPKKAIELDYNNYKAHIALSLFYLYAPSMNGGNVDSAIEELNITLMTEDSFEKFLAYGWLGYAYSKKGLDDLAEECVKRALEIYPNNLWANGILEAEK